MPSYEAGDVGRFVKLPLRLTFKKQGVSLKQPHSTCHLGPDYTLHWLDAFYGKVATESKVFLR